MMNFLLALYSSLLIKILPLLVVSLLLTFLLVKAKMPKLFYLLIVIEVIAISVLHYCKSQYKNVGLGQYKNVGFPTFLYCLFSLHLL